MTVTRIDLVLDAILAVVRAALPDDVTVADGPQIGVSMDRALCVGFTDGPDNPGYATTWVRQEGYGGRPREDFTVHCFLTLFTGDHDDQALARLRTEAAALLRVMDDAIRAAGGRSGVWDRAGLGAEAEWVPAILEDGSICNVMFDIVGTSVL